MDEQLLVGVPAAKHAAVKAWWDAEVQRGVSVDALTAQLQRQYPALTSVSSPRRAVSDATARRTESPRSNPVSPSAIPVAVATLLGTGAVAGAATGGPKVLRGVARRSAVGQLRRAITESPGGLDQLLEQVRGFRETGRGDVVTLSDLAPRLSSEVDYAATNSPVTRAALSEMNSDRQRAKPTRLLGDVERIAPNGYADAPKVLQDLNAERMAWAAGPEGYGGLREAFPELPRGANRRLSRFLSNPRVMKAWGDAASVGAVGPLPHANAMSFETIQGLKERLDALTEAAFAKSDGDLGRRLAAARDDVRNILLETVPDYRRVDATYRQYRESERAVQQGMDWYRDASLQLPELERQLQSIPEAQRGFVQKGMLGSYLADIENSRKDAGFFETMMTQLPVQQRKLEVMFGGPEAAQRALRTYQQELDMARLGQAVGGSQTAGREAQQLRSAAETAGDVAYMATHPTAAVPRIAGRGLGRWMPGAVAEEMRPMVTVRGAGEVESLLRMLMRVPK